jgi:hypothetical protein
MDQGKWLIATKKKQLFKGAKSFSAAKISSIREKDPGSVSDFGRFKSFCLFFMHSSC